MRVPSIATIEKAARLVVPDCQASFDLLNDAVLLRAYRGDVVHEAVIHLVHLRRALELGGSEHASEVIVMAAHDLEALIDDDDA
jgi:hypothetical protein